MRRDLGLTRHPRNAGPGSPGRSAGLLVAIIASIVLGVASSAWAQVSDETSSSPAEIDLVVSSVDATSDDAIVALFGADPSTSATEVELQSRAGELTASATQDSAEAGWPAEVVLVIDADNRTAASGLNGSIVGIVDDMVNQLPSGSKVGLVSAGGEADVKVGLSTSQVRVEQAAEKLRPETGSALVDGVDLAAKMLFQSASQADASRLNRTHR